MRTPDYNGSDRRAKQRTLSQQAQVFLHLNREIACFSPIDTDLIAARWMFARNLIAGKYDAFWESEAL